MNPNLFGSDTQKLQSLLSVPYGLFVVPNDDVVSHESGWVHDSVTSLSGNPKCLPRIKFSIPPILSISPEF